MTYILLNRTILKILDKRHAIFMMKKFLQLISF